MEYTAATKIGNSTVISATFTPEETAALRQQALQAKARSLHVPGFRPGKAPLGMVAKYVSNQDLKDEVIQKAASQAYLAFLKEQSDADALIFEPEIVDSTVGEELNDELKLQVRVFELPRTDQTFWKSIEVEDEPVDVTKSVERRISALVEALTETSPKEGPAEKGDAVAVTIKTEKATNPYHTELTVGEGEVGKAYEPYLVGMMPGETRHFSVQLSGSSMEGEITLESVAEKHIPPVDDNFARSVGAFENLEELRKTLEDDERRKAEEARKDALFTRAVDTAAEKLAIDFPGYVRRDATEQRLGEIKESLARNGLSLNEYLKYNNIAMEQLMKDVEADAVKALQRDLLMEATERACGIVADDAVIDEYVGEHADELTKAGIDTSTEAGRKTAGNVIVWEKTRDLIVDSVAVKTAAKTAQEEP